MPGRNCLNDASSHYLVGHFSTGPLADGHDLISQALHRRALRSDTLVPDRWSLVCLAVAHLLAARRRLGPPTGWRQNSTNVCARGGPCQLKHPVPAQLGRCSCPRLLTIRSEHEAPVAEESYVGESMQSVLHGSSCLAQFVAVAVLASWLLPWYWGRWLSNMLSLRHYPKP